MFWQSQMDFDHLVSLVEKIGNRAKKWILNRERRQDVSNESRECDGTTTGQRKS